MYSNLEVLDYRQGCLSWYRKWWGGVLPLGPLMVDHPLHGRRGILLMAIMAIESFYKAPLMATIYMDLTINGPFHTI